MHECFCKSTGARIFLRVLKFCCQRRWCRIVVWTMRKIIIRAQWMEQSMWLRVGEEPIYHNTVKWVPIGVSIETMTGDLSNWQHLITHPCCLSTRKAEMGRYMIISPFQGTTEMCWPAYTIAVQQLLWLLEFKQRSMFSNLMSNRLHCCSTVVLEIALYNKLLWNLFSILSVFLLIYFVLWVFVFLCQRGIKKKKK